MTTVRQDAWTQDEDLLLAEVVLRYIREGGTQLSAFEEVGKKLSRTSAACGFRWNSYVRKQYKQGIELAKKQRKELKTEGSFKGVLSKEISLSHDNDPSRQEKSLSLSDVIQYLHSYGQSGDLRSQNQNLREQLSMIENENDRLLREKKELEQQLELVKKDYKVLIGIMDRARKMMNLQDESQLIQK